jgi:hypothetical protein
MSRNHTYYTPSIKLLGGPADGKTVPRHTDETPPLIHVARTSPTESYVGWELVAADAPGALTYRFRKMLPDNMAAYEWVF